MEDSKAAVIKHFSDILDLAIESPPPKRAGLDSRNGLARQMILSVIDDILRLDGGLKGADWSPSDVIALKEKAAQALDALNDAEYCPLTSDL